MIAPSTCEAFRNCAIEMCSSEVLRSTQSTQILSSELYALRRACLKVCTCEAFSNCAVVVGTSEVLH